jgi:hypothetical protein
MTRASFLRSLTLAPVAVATAISAAPCPRVLTATWTTSTTTGALVRGGGMFHPACPVYVGGVVRLSLQTSP